jgi:hypothetical protein
MGIDQARDQRVFIQLMYHLGSIFRVSLGTGQYLQDVTFMHGDGVLFQYRVVWFNGNDPAGVNQGIN